MYGRRMLLAVLFTLAIGSTTGAQTPGTFEVGVRPFIVGAGGEPANDIIGAGIFGRYRLSEAWLIAAAVESAEYDFERPALLLGINQDPNVETVDAPTSATTFTVWAEREFGKPGGATRWYVGFGAGYSSVDVDTVTGPVDGGGTFEIVTDPGSEMLVIGSAGVRRYFGEHFGLELGLRLDQHFADWNVEDTVSGATGTVDSYTAWGAQGSILFRF